LAAIAGGALVAGCTATSTSNAERDYGGSNIEQATSRERPPLRSLKRLRMDRSGSS
jgi:hypothetical protein